MSRQVTLIVRHEDTGKLYEVAYGTLPEVPGLGELVAIFQDAVGQLDGSSWNKTVRIKK